MRNSRSQGAFSCALRVSTLAGWCDIVVFSRRAGVVKMRGVSDFSTDESKEMRSGVQQKPRLSPRFAYFCAETAICDTAVESPWILQIYSIDSRRTHKTKKWAAPQTSSKPHYEAKRSRDCCLVLSSAEYIRYTSGENSRVISHCQHMLLNRSTGPFPSCKQASTQVCRSHWTTLPRLKFHPTKQDNSSGDRICF